MTADSDDSHVLLSKYKVGTLVVGVHYWSGPRGSFVIVPADVDELEH